MEQAPLFELTQEHDPTRSEYERRLDAMAKRHGRKLLRNEIIRALAGDPQARKTIWDRIWPLPKGERITGVLMKPTRTAADLRDAMHDVIALMTSGRISTADGESLMKVLKDCFVAHTAVDLLPFTPDVTNEGNAQSLRVELTKRLMNAMANKTAAALPAPESDNTTAEDTTEESDGPSQTSPTTLP